jgi:hypothetical protein
MSKNSHITFKNKPTAWIPDQVRDDDLENYDTASEVGMTDFRRDVGMPESPPLLRSESL